VLGYSILNKVFTGKSGGHPGRKPDSSPGPEQFGKDDQQLSGACLRINEFR
jgi:hypothetical protein